jgi:hypothetical protein
MMLPFQRHTFNNFEEWVVSTLSHMYKIQYGERVSSRAPWQLCSSFEALRVDSEYIALVEFSLALRTTSGRRTP